MAKSRNDDSKNSGKKRQPGSTTSLGKRRSRSKSPGQRQGSTITKQAATSRKPSSAGVNVDKATSTMSNPRSSEYGSQASPLRVPSQPKDLVKVTIVGAAGGIGQPLALLLAMHSEYIHHLALYDLVDSIPGVGLDLSHIDRQVKVTTHLGPDSLADAVRGASVILVLAGLAQKPGMTRDDLFGSNAKIMYYIAKCCAQNAPDAMLCIVTNPVNSLVPLACEVYSRLNAHKAQQPADQQQQQHQSKQPEHQQQSQAQHGSPPGASSQPATQQSTSSKPEAMETNKSLRSLQSVGARQPTGAFEDCFRHIFGVTTLDVVRASTLTAKSAFYKNEPNGLFKDPGKIQVPVVGGHAGKTIMPLLSQAVPKLDRKRLVEEKATTLTVINSIQQAGIDVLNQKAGKGSATLAMAYAACRFTVSLLRAMSGEQNIIECAYVRHASPICHDLDYFAAPLLLGKDGYVKVVANYLPCGNASSGGSLISGSAGSGTGVPAAATASGKSGGAAEAASTSSTPAAPGVGSQGSGTAASNKLLPFEMQMLEDGSRELRLSIVKGEDFAREQLSADK